MVLSTVYKLKHTGWPATCRQTSSIAHKYWYMHGKLTSDDRLLLKGSRVIIPSALRKSLIKDCYKEHTGIMKCQLTAITHIKDYIKRCPTCIRLSPILPAEPLINHAVPKILAKTQHTFYGLGLQNISTHHGLLFQVSLLFHMISSTTNAVINCLTELFALEQSPMNYSLKWATLQVQRMVHFYQQIWL